MRKTMVVGALWLSVFFAFNASAQQVTEDETDTTFQKMKNFGGVPHILVGTGAREAAGMINVYGAGMYVGQKAAVKAWGSYLKGRFSKAKLVENGQPNYKKLRRSAQGRHFIVYGRMPRAIEMAFVRDVRADQVTGAYEESWDRVKLDRNAAGEALTQFMAAVNNPMKSGQRMTIFTRGNRIVVQMPSGNTKIQGNRAMVTAIWKIWFGNPPLQRPLRDGMMSMFSNVHELFTKSGN